VTGADVAGTFLRWTFLRAVFHRGYVLVSGLYFVITAHLSAFQLLAALTACAGAAVARSRTGGRRTAAASTQRRFRRSPET
jgi:hypothetical protein